MNVLLHLHPERAKVEAVLPGLLKYLESAGHKVYLCNDDKSLCAGFNVIHIDHLSECKKLLIGLAISVGGDGTFIGAARVIAGTDIPILGLHMGGLGFLAEVLLENFEDKLNQFFAGNYTIEQRKILQAKILYANHTEVVNSINDILIHRNETMGMCKFETYVDKDFLNTYRGDGLIVSTPSGSTAYNISAGGPIVLPQLDVITLTPVCPHSLSARPVIIGGKQVITFDLTQNRKQIALDIDGQRRINLNDAKEVHITNSQKTLKVVRFSDYSFFKTLQTKLNWGVDKRNENKQDKNG